MWVNESLVVLYNPHVSGWTAVKRKLHPLESNYHAIAWCEIKVIFHAEIVEGKDKLKEGMRTESEFKMTIHSNIPILYL